MGDMTDYTLEGVIQAEAQRADYKSGFMSDEDAYDLGIIDEMGAPQEPHHLADVNPFALDYEEVAAQLDIVDNESHVGFNCYGDVFTAKYTVKDIKAKSKTYQYLLGFAKHYKNKGWLSNKQKAVVETNWKGGSSKFISDLETSADEIIKVLEDIIEGVEHL